MEGIFIPVPNQPLYVWPIRTSAFFSRGYVRGNGRMQSIGLHGHVLMGGTQSITVSWPSTSSKILDKIFMYGYPLYTWYGRTPYGGSRYRIPFIVWVWKKIIANASIIAKMGSVDQAVGIYAQTYDVQQYADIHAHSIVNESQVDLSYSRAETYQEGYIAYTTDKVYRTTRYALAAAVDSSMVQSLKMQLSLHRMIENTLKLSVHPHRKTQERVLKMAVSSSSPMESRVYKLMASTVSPNIGRGLKMKVSTSASAIERTLSLVADTRVKIHERIHKLTTHVSPVVIERTTKMVVHTHPPYGNRLFKLMTHVRPIDQKVIKFSVHPVPSEIEPVRGFIETNLVSHFHSKKMALRGYYGSHPTKKVTIRSTVEEYAERHITVQGVLGANVYSSINLHGYLGAQSKDSIRLLALLRECIYHPFAVRTETGHHIRSVRDFQFLSTTIENKNHSVSIPLSVQPSRESLIMASLVEAKRKYDQLVSYATVAYRDQRTKISVRTLAPYEQWHRVELDVLPLLAEHQIKFFPSEAPFVEQIGVMVSVCQTHILSYLNFVPDTLQQDVDVLISTCSYTTASLLQWYLHSNRITNEGGNEIIFDIGEVDPVGPIPPVPSRTWEGGYVEDPFKGISYQPATDSTGFGSPSAETWVSNTQMWWSSTSNPWVEPE